MSLYSNPALTRQSSASSLPTYLYAVAIYLAIVLLTDVSTHLYSALQIGFKYFDGRDAAYITLNLALCVILVTRPLLQSAYSLIPNAGLGIVTVALLLCGTLKEGIPNTSFEAGYYKYPDAVHYIVAPPLLPRLLLPQRDSVTPRQYHSVLVANYSAGTLVVTALCALLFYTRRNHLRVASTSRSGDWSLDRTGKDQPSDPRVGKD